MAGTNLRRALPTARSAFSVASPQTARGAPIAEYATAASDRDFNDDVLQVTSSNPSVAEFVPSTPGGYLRSEPTLATLHGQAATTWTLPILKALAHGSSTITVQDTSNPTEPAAKFTLHVR